MEVKFGLNLKEKIKDQLSLLLFQLGIVSRDNNFIDTQKEIQNQLN